MDPRSTEHDQTAQEALAALEQAFAYFSPEPLPAAEPAEAEDWPVPYYQAA